MVTIDNETKQYEVVDGQQRLTTIKLLLSAIRDTAAEIRKLNQDQRISSNIEKLNANINSLLFSNPHTYSKYERRFVPNSHDQDVHQYITYYLPGEDHEIEHAITKLFNSSPEFKALDSKIDFLKSIKIWNSARHFRSFKAYKFFSEKISESVFGKSDSEKIQFLIDLVAKCADGLQLMIFSSSNEAEAFNLFETLNDRGLGLAAVDLIKNKVLQRTNEQYRDDVAKKWDEIFGNNGYVDAGSHNLFLRHYYNCQYDFITKQGIYSGYSAIIAKLNTPDKLNQWILELNTSASDFYQFKNVIIDGKAFFAENAELQNIFLLLKKTGSVQWYTLAFSLLKVYRENPELKTQIIRALWLTLNLILRFMLLNEKFNKIETKIPKIARSIWDKAKYPIFDEGSEDQEYFETNFLAVCYACEQLEKLIAKYVPDEILYPDASYKDSPIYKDIDDNNLANTLLRIIALKKGPSGFSPKLDLTLEHILPIEHKKWSPDVSGFEPEQAKKYQMILNQLLNPLNIK